MSTLVCRSRFGFVMSLVWLAISLGGPRGSADDFQLRPTIDYMVIDTGGDGSWNSVTTTSTDLRIRQFPGIVQERSLASYYIGTIPADAVITDVSLTYTALVVTGNSERRVSFLYVPGTTVSTADATRAGTLLTSYDLFAPGLGRHTFSLGPAAVTALTQARQSGLDFPIRLQAFGDTVNHAVAANEWDVNDVMVLNVTTAAVPEPATLAVAGLIMSAAAGGYFYLSRRRLVDAELHDDAE